MAIEHDKDFQHLFDIKADGLEDHYTGIRYPILVKVTEQEANEAIRVAEEVKGFLLRKLSNSINP